MGDWTAGQGTTLSIAGGRARATSTAGANPRISREVGGLDAGSTYRVQTTVYPETIGGSYFFRAADDQNLTMGDYMNIQDTQAIDHTFTAPAGGVAYLGIVGVAGQTGQFLETDEDFTLTKE